MPHLGVGDRVKETTTSTGTGTINLDGAVTGFQTFVDGVGNGHETYYVIVDPGTGDYEVGVGTITDAATDTLSRDSVITSSNADALVNFGAGTKDVFCSLPSERAVIIDDASNVEVTANITATAFDGSGAALTSLNASNVSSGTLDNARLDAQLQDIAGLATTSGKIIQGDGANFVLSSYTIPTSDGTTGQVLTTNGSGAVTFQTPTVGDITAVTAGDGLTGGGTSGDVTLNVGAGTGVTVNADDIAIGQDVATSASPTFAGGTFTANVALGDLDHILMGATGEYQIYHDHANGVSVIKDVDAGGSINIEADSISLTGPVVGTSTVNAATFNGSGAGLTSLNASNLSSGTIPDARFPATIPASSGANLTNLNASNVSSGTLSSDRLSTVPTTKGGTGLTAIGTANQVLAVNSGGTALEYQTISADITGVTAGNGLTGGGTSGDVTLNVGAGTGVTVNADDIAIGQDVATSASPTFAGATFTANVSLGDGDYLRFGQNPDFLIFHDGSDSYIQDQGAGNFNLTTNGTQIILRKSTTETMATFVVDGAVSLYYDNSKKFETTSGGISVTGTATATTFSGSGASLTSIPNAALDNSSITINGTGVSLGGSINVGDITGVTAGNGLTGGGTTGDVTLNVGAGTGIDVAADAISVDVSDFMSNGSNNRVLTATGTDGMNAEANMTFDGSTLAVTGGATFSANVSLSDNDYLRFGNSQDLLIYHDGSNSIIQDNGTGNLEIRAAAQVQIMGGADGLESMAFFEDNGPVGLYYDNVKKFETTSAGVTITGTLTETSSIEYKENVQPLEFNEAIYNVNAVKYDRKDGSQKDEVGVIAEDLYEILPDLVQIKDGKPDAVKYTKMTMYLLEALKKQNEEIKMLKEKLN